MTENNKPKSTEKRMPGLPLRDAAGLRCSKGPLTRIAFLVSLVAFGPLPRQPVTAGAEEQAARAVRPSPNPVIHYSIDPIRL